MKRARGWVAASGLAVVSALALGGSAAAAEVSTVLVFTGQTSQTVEYGQFWAFPFTVDYRFANPTTTAEMAGPFEGPLPVYVNLNTYPEATGYVALPEDQPFTPAGNYQVYVTLRTLYGGDLVTATTATPATLVVTPAPLSVQQRVVADPNNPTHAIISAELSGNYIDSWGWTAGSTSGSTPRLPVGTWAIRVTQGDVVLVDEQVPQPANRIPSVSYYWSDVPLAADVSTTVTFTPSTALQGSFDIGQAPAFAFTSGAEGRPVPVADAAGTDTDTVAAAPGPTFPLWLLILAGVIAAASIAAIVVLVVRLRALAGVQADSPDSDTPPTDDPTPGSAPPFPLEALTPEADR